MSDFLRTAVGRVQSTLTGWSHGLAARLVRDERGQDTVEYFAVLTIVAVLIAGGLTIGHSLVGSLTGFVGKTVSGMFG
jgi:Flp pilus assembly pilin Flp